MCVSYVVCCVCVSCVVWCVVCEWACSVVCCSDTDSDWSQNLQGTPVTCGIFLQICFISCCHLFMRWNQKFWVHWILHWSELTTHKSILPSLDAASGELLFICVCAVTQEYTNNNPDHLIGFSQEYVICALRSAFFKFQHGWSIPRLSITSSWLISSLLFLMTVFLSFIFRWSDLFLLFPSVCVVSPVSEQTLEACCRLPVTA